MAQLFHITIVETLHANFKLLGKLRRIVPGKLFKQGLQLRVGHFVSNSGFQFDEGTILNIRVIADFQRKVNISVVPGEARRHDPDDRIALVDKLKGAPHYRRVGIEMPLPEKIAKNDNGLWVLAIRGVGGDQSAAQQGGDAEMSTGIR